MSKMGIGGGRKKAKHKKQSGELRKVRVNQERGELRGDSQAGGERGVRDK